MGIQKGTWCQAIACSTKVGRKLLKWGMPLYARDATLRIMIPAMCGRSILIETKLACKAWRMHTVGIIQEGRVTGRGVPTARLYDARSTGAIAMASSGSGPHVDTI